MISTGCCFPLEVWLNIFSHVSSQKDLANCRLLCKTLDPIAEKAMFKQVSIRNNNHVTSLYNHLIQKPTLAQHIQCIRLYTDNPIEMKLFKKIMPILLTSHLKRFAGTLSSDGRYLKALLAILRKPAFDCVKVHKLPYAKHLTKDYVNLACHFKETLPSLSFTLFDNVDQTLLRTISLHMLQLKRVTQLYIFSYDSTDDKIERLEKLLKGLVHLKTFNWKMKHQYPRNSPPKPGFKDWLSKEVNQVESLQTLTFGNYSLDQCDPEVLLYFSYKYPNIKTLEMEGHWSGRQHYYPVFESVEAFHLKKWLVCSLDGIELVANVWKRQSNSIRIRYQAPDTHYVKGECILDVKKEKQQDHTLFDFDYVYYTTPLKSFVVFLSAFGDTAMKKLDIDLKFFEELGHYNDTYSSDLLKAASSSVECLKLNASGLELKERLDLTRLHTVELIDMYILTEDMTHLGLSCPSLKHLTLSSCCLCEKQTCNSPEATQVVNLFSNHLITLSVNGDVISREDRKAGIKEDMHIHLSVGQADHYFIARRSSNTRHLPSQQNNVLYTKPPYVVTIKCGSLQKFKVDFEDVKFEVEFDDEGIIKQADQ